MHPKLLGRIPAGGWRAQGRETVTQPRSQYQGRVRLVHSVIDDHSRYGHREILPNELASTCAAFLRCAAQAFATAVITTMNES